MCVKDKFDRILIIETKFQIKFNIEIGLHNANYTYMYFIPLKYTRIYDLSSS